ncbi:MAG: hypothetical protein QOJ07_1209 [Thermoleophilaceae bacterium]|nr:hypothetical protein [Thermoleophilaceae bacterium]
MEFALPTAVAGPGSAPELDFEVGDGGVLQHAAVPTLRFDLGIEAVSGPTQVRSVALNIEVRIAATRRGYDRSEQDKLFELFGRASEWGRNLRTLHWTALTANVPPFRGATRIELPVTCTYDLDVTGSRYMNALEDGEVPLEFLFSGTVFYSDPGGRLQIGRIGWDKEATYRLPVAAWREMMDRYFPDSAWLRLRRDQFDALTAYRARHAFMSWEDTVDALLRETGEDS